MSIAWKIGRAIKPLSGHATLVFSPDNAVSRCVSKIRGLVRRKSSPNIGTTIYIEGFQWSRSDGGGEASPARAAGGSEMAEARPGYCPPLRPEGVGPPRRRLGRQTDPVHVRRVPATSVRKSGLSVPLRHGLDHVRQRVGRGHGPRSGGARADPLDRALRDLPVRGRLYDIPSAQRPLRFGRPPQVPVGRQAAPDRTRGTRAPPRAEALRVQ